MPHILFWGKADKMKHGTYVKGVATGVILTVLAAGLMAIAFFGFSGLIK